mmetsp:Transcript_30250/g.60216  ORF Transcript_30250/g.60216 Transcript_30250/m.60216 type:complete len:103 (+) Transcript_30250:382-690(+)
MLDAMLDRLQAAEENAFQVFPVPVEKYGGNVQVALAVVDIPAEADRDVPEVLRQVQDGALFHREGNLLPLRRPGNEAADDGGQQRQNVHEMPPLLGREVDDP